MQNSKRTITAHVSAILIDNIYDLNLFYVHNNSLIVIIASTTDWPVEIVTTTTVKPVCSKCAINEKSGLASCCASGGDWFQQCGEGDDANFEHTWTDGIDACQGK